MAKVDGNFLIFMVVVVVMVVAAAVVVVVSDCFQKCNFTYSQISALFLFENI